MSQLASVLHRRSGRQVATVMRYADQALYEAKHSGRNRVVQVNSRMELIAPKRHALKVVGD
jgi:hypothetical protein